MLLVRMQYLQSDPWGTELVAIDPTEHEGEPARVLLLLEESLRLRPSFFVMAGRPATSTALCLGPGLDDERLANESSQSCTCNAKGDNTCANTSSRITCV